MILLSRWCLLLGEVEFNGLEFLVAIQIALEMLKQHYFLVYRLRVVKEVELGDLICHTVKRLPGRVENRLLLGPLDIIKVEQVGMKNDFGAVVEEHSVGAV